MQINTHYNHIGKRKHRELHMHTSEYVAGENNRFLIASVRESESERGRGRRERDVLGLTTFKHVLVCVNTKAIAGEGEKKDKRQHKYDASLK